MVSAFLPADPLGSIPGEAAGLPAEGQKQQGRASTGRQGGTRWRCHRLVTGVLLLSADRVLQPRAVPAEAQQHAPLHLWHLCLPPSLRCHRESSRPRSRPLLGRRDPVSGRVALGWQRRGVVNVTQTPPVPTPALGLDSDLQRGGAGDVWGHGGDTKGWDVLVLGVSEPRCASLGVSLPQPRGDRGATVHVPTSQAARGTTRLFPRPCCPSGLSPAADGAATPLGPVII